MRRGMVHGTNRQDRQSGSLRPRQENHYLQTVEKLKRIYDKAHTKKKSNEKPSATCNRKETNTYTYIEKEKEEEGRRKHGGEEVKKRKETTLSNSEKWASYMCSSTLGWLSLLWKPSPMPCLPFPKVSVSQWQLWLTYFLGISVLYSENGFPATQCSQKEKHEKLYSILSNVILNLCGMPLCSHVHWPACKRLSACVFLEQVVTVEQAMQCHQWPGSCSMFCFCFCGSGGREGGVEPIKPYATTAWHAKSIFIISNIINVLCLFKNENIIIYLSNGFSCQQQPQRRMAWVVMVHLRQWKAWMMKKDLTFEKAFHAVTHYLPIAVSIASILGFSATTLSTMSSIAIILLKSARATTKTYFNVTMSMCINNEKAYSSLKKQQNNSRKRKTPFSSLLSGECVCGSMSDVWAWAGWRWVAWPGVWKEAGEETFSQQAMCGCGQLKHVCVMCVLCASISCVMPVWHGV